MFFRRSSKRKITIGGHKQVGQLLGHLVHDRFVMCLHKVDQDEEYLNKEDYEQGWMDGVKAFWEKVKNALLPDKKKRQTIKTPHKKTAKKK